MRLVLFSLFYDFICFWVFTKTSVSFINIVDTVSLEGIVLFETGYGGTYFLSKTEIQPKYTSYRKIKKLYRHAQNKILSPDLINSPYVYDSAEVTLKMDTALCKERLEFSTVKGSRLIYSDKDRKVYALKMTGLFYRLKVLDRLAYAKRRKIKYDDYIAFYCLQYRTRTYILLLEEEGK